MKQFRTSSNPSMFCLRFRALGIPERSEKKPSENLAKSLTPLAIFRHRYARVDQRIPSSKLVEQSGEEQSPVYKEGTTSSRLSLKQFVHMLEVISFASKMCSRR